MRIADHSAEQSIEASEAACVAVTAEFDAEDYPQSMTAAMSVELTARSQGFGHGRISSLEALCDIEVAVNTIAKGPGDRGQGGLRLWFDRPFGWLPGFGGIVSGCQLCHSIAAHKACNANGPQKSAVTPGNLSALTRSRNS